MKSYDKMGLKLKFFNLEEDGLYNLFIFFKLFHDNTFYEDQTDYILDFDINIEDN